MAKKKKPAANPARGFATTSIASKPKLEKPAEPLPVDKNETKEPSAIAAEAGAPPFIGKKPDQELETHQLSPEELEKRLEDAELSGLIEKFAPKSQRDSARHVSKLTTDFRLLRSHAQPLPTRHLLPFEMMTKVLALAVEDVNAGRLLSTDENLGRKAALQEEDVIGKLWTLQKALLELSFAQKHIDDAFDYLLEFPPSMEQTVAMWGLEESLDWLTLNLEDGDLPAFDETGKSKESAPREAETSEGTTTPTLAIQSLRNEPIDSPEPKAQSETPDTVLDDDDMEVSDLGSDLEPDELLSTYLSTKLRLYEARPDLIDTSKRNSTKRVPISSSAKPRHSSGVKKLQTKLQKIESDVLFDQREAEYHWSVKHNAMARELAERRKLQLPQQMKKARPAPKPKPVEKQVAFTNSKSYSSDDTSSSDEDDVALGDLFGSVASGANKREVPPTNGQNSALECSIDIVDFGPIQGLTPWRILEEACHARDTRSTVSFKLVSASAFACRHSVTLKWTKDQDPSCPIQSDIVSTESASHSCTFTMVSVATPDSQQSKAYISTFALFQIFSSSPREEKAYLRLAPVWRDLWMELVDQRKTDIEAAERETVRKLRDRVRAKIESDDGRDDVVLTRNFQKRINDNSGRSIPGNPDREASVAPFLDEHQLKNIWLTKSSSPNYQRMLLGRINLPMYRFRDAALETVERNQVTILCGETGCGKSTQMPSYILERELSLGRACKIYCTEPRRISAITLAQRVSEELGESKQDVGTTRSLVGYAIRLESHVSSTTRLVFATTGIVLRMLESKDGFDGVTHIVIDEVHERSIETDFLLIILRSLLNTRPELKVVLMSATVDAQRFSSYFHGAPILTVPGRTFPVETKFLEDAVELTGYSIDENHRGQKEVDDDNDVDEQAQTGTAKPIDSSRLQGYSARTRNALLSFDEYRIDFQLIYSLVEMIAFNPNYQPYSKAILVFLPGIGEIRRLNDMLQGTQISHHFVIHSLHSSIASEDQQAAFGLPPRDMGKIVLSTNIAETGVTIPDVTCVIDTGKHKEMRFDERRQISRLIESFISRANAKQRRGRAGRVQEGLCFHLFTKARHDESMSDQQTPEMLRLSLQDLVMRVKICKLGDIQTTLAEALDPPSAKNIRRAIDALIDVGALTSSEALTPLGQQLSKLPLDPYLGKLVLFGVIFGCLDISLTLAAILTSKSPFVTGIGGRSQADAARAYFKKGDSDLLTEFNAYAAWRRVCMGITTGTSYSSELQFCRKSSLSPQTLGNIEDLKAQLFSAIVDAGLASSAGQDRSALSRIQNSNGGRNRRFVSVPDTLNMHASNNELVASVIAWSFYPKLLTRDGKGWRNVATNQSISIHPTSIVRGANLPNVKFLSFYSILQSSGTRNYNANSLTPCAALPLVFLAGDAAFHSIAQVVSIDGARLRFVIDSWKLCVALKYLRRRLEEIVERAWKGKQGSDLGRRLERWMRLWNEIVEGWAASQASREA